MKDGKMDEVGCHMCEIFINSSPCKCRLWGDLVFSLVFCNPTPPSFWLVLPSGRNVLPGSGNLFVWRPLGDLKIGICPLLPLSELYFRSAVKIWGFLQAFNSEVFWKTVILFVLCCMHVVSSNMSVIILCTLSIANTSLTLQAQK